MTGGKHAEHLWESRLGFRGSENRKCFQLILTIWPARNRISVLTLKLSREPKISSSRHFFWVSHKIHDLYNYRPPKKETRSWGGGKHLLWSDLLQMSFHSKTKRFRFLLTFTLVLSVTKKPKQSNLRLSPNFTVSVICKLTQYISML